MSTLTPVQVSNAGADSTPVAAAGGGDSIAVGANSGHVLLEVNNGSGSTVTVTIAGVKTCNLGSLHDQVFTVAAGARKTITIKDQCVDPTTGAAAVTYSSATSVTVQALLV